MNMRINRYTLNQIEKLRYRSETKVLELDLKNELPFFEFKTNAPPSLEGERHPVHVLNNFREALLKVQQLEDYNIKIEIDFNESD
ncbi:MAG: hypothetical protein L6Q37_11700 [Bdellovibrionaceae bacterium]|nr:hypothetical protein [Leptospiraceae bacterium]MCK6599020.1 hypothetical protein [Pseudobdellovibrionaceae bacterium]NUM41970.1 hypothetical protein [Leptospiraceae bacterium]